MIPSLCASIVFLGSKKKNSLIISNTQKYVNDISTCEMFSNFLSDCDGVYVSEKNSKYNFCSLIFI